MIIAFNIFLPVSKFVWVHNVDELRDVRRDEGRKRRWKKLLVQFLISTSPLSKLNYSSTNYGRNRNGDVEDASLASTPLGSNPLTRCMRACVRMPGSWGRGLLPGMR